MSSEFGRNIKFQFFGQSHSEGIGVVIDGLPAGIPIDTEKINRFMARRSPGKSHLTTKRREPDIPEIISGLYNGRTCGAPLCAVIKNTDTKSGDYDLIRDTPRPSHADYTAFIKYGGYQDHRGGGQFSGRLTAPLCFAGAVCMQALESLGINIYSHIFSVGNIHDEPFEPNGPDPDIISVITGSDFPAIDPNKADMMKSLIEDVAKSNDSVGGVIECIVTGVPAGTGEPVYDSIEGRISSVLFGIPGVKGVEFGNGFAGASMFGSENNDQLIYENDTVKTITNNSGGINGGIANGAPILFRAAFKPTPSIAKQQNTINLKNKINTTISISGRHDPCIAARACPCVESAAAAVILDMMLDKRSVL